MKKIILATVLASVFAGVAHAHEGKGYGKEGVFVGSASMGTNSATELSVGYATKSDIIEDSIVFVEANQFEVADKINNSEFGVKLQSKSIGAGLMKKEGDFGYGVAVNYSETKIDELNYKREGLGLEGHVGYHIGKACVYGNVNVKPDFLSTTNQENLYAELDLKVGAKYALSKKVAVFSEVKSGMAYDSNDKRTDLYSTVGAGVSVAF